MKTKKVVIVGAGIIGATSALSLAEAGYKVDVIDKAIKLGKGASGNNGAQLSYNYTDAMASPQLLKSLPKMLLGRDPSFRMVAKLDWDYIKWSFNFLRNCSQSQSDKNTLKVLDIALKSAIIMHAWIKKYNFNFDFTTAQKLHLYESKKTFHLAMNRAKLKNRYGGNQHILTSQETLSLEPSISESTLDLVGSIHSPDDEVGDVKKFTQAALNKAFELGGGKLHLNTKLLGFTMKNNHCHHIVTSQAKISADKIIICAGDACGKLAKLCHVNLPIMPISGYSLTYEAIESTPSISLTDTTKKIVLCKLGKQLRIAGMADVGRGHSIPPEKRIDTLKNIVKHRFPMAANYHGGGQPWVGIRPMTPDSVPIIKQLKLSNVYINSGHGMLGWTLAAGSSEIIKRLIDKSA